MDVFTLSGICAKRWYVLLPLLALAGLFAYRTAESHPTVYTASNSMIVLAPNVYTPNDLAAAGGSVGVNPFGTSYVTAASALTQALQDPATAREVQRVAGRASYSVTQAAFNQPILDISATGPTAPSAAEELQAVTTVAQDTFKSVQTRAGSPPGALLQLVPISTGVGGISVGQPGRIKSALTIGGAGLLVAILVTVAVDALLRRRRRNRRGSRRAKSHEPDQAPVESLDADAHEVTAADRSSRGDVAGQEPSPPGRQSDALLPRDVELFEHSPLESPQVGISPTSESERRTESSSPLRPFTNSSPIGATPDAASHQSALGD